MTNHGPVMRGEDEESKLPRRTRRDRTLTFPILGVLAFILVILASLYAAQRLETLQYRLAHNPHVSDALLPSSAKQTVSGQSVYVPVYAGLIPIAGPIRRRPSL